MGPLGYPLFFACKFVFRKFVGCGGPKLTGGASGRGVLRGTFGPGPKEKKKKRKHGHNYPSLEVLVSNFLFFLSAYSTVTLYSHSKF